MHIATLKMTPPSREKQKVLGAFRAILSWAGRSPGCLECSFFAETEPDEAILIVERWRSEEDLRRHLQSDTYRKILELVELSTEPPEIRFYRVVEAFGLELVEQIRGQETV